MKFSTPNRKNFIRYFKIFSYFQVSVFCFFKFFNRRSLSHTIHGIFLHMKLRPVLRFFLILDKNAPVFYRWKICPHIRFFPAKFFFFFYRHICSVIPWGNACEAAEIIDYINSSAPVSSFKLPWPVISSANHPPDSVLQSEPSKNLQTESLCMISV